MNRDAVRNIGKIALAKLHDATEQAAKGQPSNQAVLDALSLIAALAEAVQQEVKR